VKIPPFRSLRGAPLLVSLVLLAGCAQGAAGRWLPAAGEPRTEAIERQFAGMSAAMKEIGYRYAELHWAGEDANWEYAAYQIDKLVDALERGIERRPARGASARVFLQQAVPPVVQAAEAGDPAAFETAFERLTAGCNACHAAEAVPFVRIGPPAIRASPTLPTTGLP
jgi:hypothetical protein